MILIGWGRMKEKKKGRRGHEFESSN